MIWAMVSSRSYFSWLYRASPYLVAKNIINFISMLIIWWCPYTEKSLGLLENGVCWEGLGAGGEGDNRGWDGWMASPTRWTWVWVNSGSLWCTGRPGVLWFTESQRVGHDWVTELNWTELQPVSYYNSYMCVCMWGMGGGSCISITLCLSCIFF